MYLFRGSIGPITDVLEQEFETTSSGIGILSSSYFFTGLLTQLLWGLFLQTYPAEIALAIAVLSLSVLCLLFPLATATPNPLVFASIVRAFGGALTPQLWLILVALAAKRFGNNYVSTIASIGLLCGTMHVIVGNVIQAELYEAYQVWKPTYYCIALMSLIYEVILLICMFADNRDKRINNQKQPEPTSPHRSLCRRLLGHLKRTIQLPLNWVVGGFYFCGCVVYVGGVQLWVVPYLTAKYNYTRSVSSAIAGAAVLAGGVSAIGCGNVSRKFKKRKVLMLCGSACFLAFVAFVYVPKLHLVWVGLLAVMTGLGAGSFPIVFTLAREYTHNHGAADTATGFMNTLLYCGSAFGQYTIGALLDLSYERSHREGGESDGGVREYSADDYDFAFVVAPVCLALMVVFGLFLKETNGENVNWNQDLESPEPCARVTSVSSIGVNVAELGSYPDTLRVSVPNNSPDV